MDKGGSLSDNGLRADFLAPSSSLSGAVQKVPGDCVREQTINHPPKVSAAPLPSSGAPGHVAAYEEASETTGRHLLLATASVAEGPAQAPGDTSSLNLAPAVLTGRRASFSEEGPFLCPHCGAATTFDRVRFDDSEREIVFGAQRVRLPSQLWLLLKLLRAANGRTVPAGTLDQEIWGYRDHDPNALAVAIVRLRKLLKPVPLLVLNSFGHGYRLVSAP